MTAFTTAELDTLRTYGIVLFADRVIFDAQPPMSAGDLAQVRRACAGPLPAGLLALWTQTAGGRLDYDLAVSMDGHQEAVSWVELFYNGSDDYHDLKGWIEHERGLIDEMSTRHRRWWRPSKLTHLPIGGYSYTDRIYIGVEPGPEHGEVVAWKNGLPGWTGQLPEDGLGAVAGTIEQAFAALCLEDDPLAPVAEFPTGRTLFDYLDEQQERGLGDGLRAMLVGYYRRALLDWATPLAAGDLGSRPALARVAMWHAIATDDAGLVGRLADAGTELDAPLRGSLVALEIAAGRGAFAAAAALVRAGALVPPQVFQFVAGAITAGLTAALLAGGASPEMSAVVRCVACGAPDSARLIAAAAAPDGTGIAVAFDVERRAQLVELESELAKVVDPAAHYGHYLGASGLTEQIERLRRFDLGAGPGSRA